MLPCSSPLSAHSAQSAQPGELPGLWRRVLICWPDGTSDRSSRVRWLQGTSAFVDLRQPVDLWRPSDFSTRPDLAQVRSLEELSQEHCLRLARQEGFAGQLSFDGSHFEWRHLIDFQPVLQCDAAALHWQGEQLVETDRDAHYVQRWQRQRSTPTQPRCALGVWDPQEGIAGSLLRVGPFFMYARDRSVALPKAGSLEAAVAACSSVAQARALVSCEISFGSIHRGRFIISASTLPWRVGDALLPQLGGEHLNTQERTPEGQRLRRWEVRACEGEPAALSGE